ncbi:hypothetical protein RAZWK3B_12032 [Roseobacter sp. AzwK-3b]|nr:hypothetical protein RAZWK3B_12032 [Roseobacter sp. AzwK-3b]
MSAPANIAQGQLMPVRELALGGNFLIKPIFINIGKRSLALTFYPLV